MFEFLSSQEAVTVTGIAIAMLSLEGIKFLIRKFVVKDMTYEMPMKLYYFSIPVLTFLSVPFLALLGFTDYSLPSDWVTWVQEGLRVVVSSLVQVFLYNGSLKQLKESAQEKQLLGK